ncbi:peptide deformylase [Phytophthora nicotianae CJ01A1]|uniref:Peptide deformylase n=8 Tax=Phytophthora nicotianae TaxID=4792 RepID=W2Q8C0_PHYN3|nr:peptide deformylase [Phytophthora nicotianae INRA-310]ETK86456.1 peptide deformylase [Phytophthora nicotianae]ETP16319.1 peptide deformylase [Phytophthora nicotianae CJ01A1]ETP44372.1 peptide deformylase [Phytophthora nicotianae P10297]KUF76658.1 Peptide deformylase 2 [Phytophthora nicotianae]ETL39874.1 peptide deformylase [Phytophthora nicotianae]
MTLVFLGNSALRRVSKSVADVRAPAVRRLLEDLDKEVRVEAGVGIAAPQLAHNLRMFLMIKNMPENEDDLSNLEYQAVLNPEIVAMSKSTKRDFEGCLSVPGYQGIVKRAEEIRVQYQDAEGRKIQETLTDFPARVFQHELDHLNGVMYLDRMETGSLIHNEEFEAMEWLDIQKLLLQGPPKIPPLMVPTSTQTGNTRQGKGKGNRSNKY